MEKSLSSIIFDHIYIALDLRQEHRNLHESGARLWNEQGCNPSKADSKIAISVSI